MIPMISISVKLKGKGVRPDIEIEPPNGLMNVGSVLLDEQIDKTFVVKNISNFQVYFKLLTLANGMPNNNGSAVFSYIPSEASIEAHSQLEVKVIFKPDKISEKFFELISIDVPNQNKEQRVFLYGSCYNRTAYIKYNAPYLSLP